MKNKRELIILAQYVRGFADATQNEKLADASDALIKLSLLTCGQGFTCNGGDTCSSEHK